MSNEITTKMRDTSQMTPIEIALGMDENGMVSAKKLYEFLELNPSNYARWIKNNVLDNPVYDEDVDYIVVRHDVEREKSRFGESLNTTQDCSLKEDSNPKSSETAKNPVLHYDERENQGLAGIFQNEESENKNFPGNPNPTQDYLLEESTAKELCMTARNEKGKIARKYFLKTESELKRMVRQVLPVVQEQMSLMQKRVEQLGKFVEDKTLVLEQKQTNLEARMESYDSGQTMATYNSKWVIKMGRYVTEISDTCGRAKREIWDIVEYFIKREYGDAYEAYKQGYRVRHPEDKVAYVANICADCDETRIWLEEALVKAAKDCGFPVPYYEYVVPPLDEVFESKSVKELYDEYVERHTPCEEEFYEESEEEVQAFVDRLNALEDLEEIQERNAQRDRELREKRKKLFENVE